MPKNYTMNPFINPMKIALRTIEMKPGYLPCVQVPPLKPLTL